MTARLTLMLAIALLTVSCRQVGSATAVTDDTMHCEASFLLGAGAELRLLSDGNLSQLELYYGGDLQELVGTANTDYVRNDSGQITLDTITDTALAPAYVVRTFRPLVDLRRRGMVRPLPLPSRRPRRPVEHRQGA